MVPNPGSITWGMLENPQPLSQDLCTEGLGVNVFQSCSGHDSVRPALESLTASSDSITRGMMCVRQNLPGVLTLPKLRQTCAISMGPSRQGPGHLRSSQDPWVSPMDVQC